MDAHIEIPKRIFLDTSFVNFLLEYGEQIFDGVQPYLEKSSRVISDINASANIFLLGKRANWELALSPITYSEIIATKYAPKKKELNDWFYEIWNHWQENIKFDTELPTFQDVEKLRVSWLSSTSLNALPDIQDRLLIVDAMTYRCDTFCTRDWKTILKHRETLSEIPLKIITPTEWWNIIKPYAQLF